jgi:hypothetical protein
MTCSTCGSEIPNDQREHVDIILDLGQDRKLVVKLPCFGKCQSCVQTDMQGIIDGAPEDYKERMWDDAQFSMRQGPFDAAPLSITKLS